MGHPATRMSPRALGSTRLMVTPIGLGLAALGRPGYINLGRDEDLGRARSVEALEGRAHEVLDAAYEAGVRYFDAARSYGRAEEFLAHWLKARRIPADAVTVGSKWGYTYVGQWRTDAPVHEVKDHSLQMLRRQIAESRELLGDHLDLYQIHSATLESGVLDDESVLREDLLLLQVQYEEGDIDDDEYAEREAALMVRLREVKARKHAQAEQVPVDELPAEANVGARRRMVIETPFDE